MYQPFSGATTTSLIPVRRVWMFGYVPFAYDPAAAFASVVETSCLLTSLSAQNIDILR